MILVYQMGKVASRSWVEAARHGGGDESGPPVHCHYMVPENRRRIERALADLPDQTIANMLLPHHMLRSGAAAWRDCLASRESGRRLRAITGMRDPVARSISLVLFMIDFYGDKARPLRPGVEASAETVVGFLYEIWDAVLNGREPAATFDWLAWYRIGGFRTWFQDEFAVAFGVDPCGAGAPDMRATCRIDAPDADVLIYRMEDMFPDASGYRSLLAEAQTFLGVELDGLPWVNAGGARRSHALATEVRRLFRLPPERLDAIYGDPVVRRCYTVGEVAEFRRRWG